MADLQDCPRWATSQSVGLSLENKPSLKKEDPHEVAIDFAHVFVRGAAGCRNCE